MASILDNVRAQRAQQKGAKRLTLPVPGWSGLLHVRYKPVEWEALDALLSATAETATDRLSANLDALVKACDALLVKNAEGDLVSLAAELRTAGVDVTGEVRYDSDAVEALELELDHDRGKLEGLGEAKLTVLAAFDGAISPELAVAEQAARLGAWHRGVDLEVDEAVLGGS